MINGYVRIIRLNAFCGVAQTRGLRVAVNPLVYVNFPTDSVFLINLSDRGMAVQAMDVLAPGQDYQFSFPLPDSDAEIHGLAKVAWSDQSGRAGLRFVRLSDNYRHRLTQWVIRHQESSTRTKV